MNHGNPFVIVNVYSSLTYDSCEPLCYVQFVFPYDSWEPLYYSMFIPLWHMIPGNPFVIFNVYSSLTYDSWEPLCYLQCLFLFDIWFLGTPLLSSMFIPLWHMIPVNPLCYLQCLFLFDIWFLGTPLLSSMFIPLWHMIPGNPFVIFNVYSSLTYDSWEPLCYLQCLFLFDIWFLWIPLLSSMFIPLWHMIPGNPFVIFNVYSSLTYDSWEPICYRQCLFLFDIWFLGIPLLSSMFIPLWHMIPGNPFVMFNVYSSLTYDSCEPLCYLQCLFLFDIWFLWSPVLSSMFIPLWHMIPENPIVIFNVYPLWHMNPGYPFVIFNVYSSLTYDSWEPLCYLQCLFLFDIWFLWTPLLSSMFIPLWHMIPENPFVIFNVYSSLTYDSWEPLCYLQCLFLFDIWFLGTPLLSSMFIPLWHMIPVNPFVIFNVSSSLTYDSWEPLCYLQCLFLFDIWFLGTPVLSSMFIPLWHMIHGNRQCLFLFDMIPIPLLSSMFIPLWHMILGKPCVIFNVYSSLTYDSWEPLCYLQCLFLFDIWFLGTPLLSSMFIPLWHMIPGNPIVIFNVYSSLTYDHPLGLFLFDIWFLGIPLLSSFNVYSSLTYDSWTPLNPFVIFNVYSSLTYESWESHWTLFDIWFLGTPLLSSMFIPFGHMIPVNPFVIFNVYSSFSMTYDSWEPLCYLQYLFLFDMWFLGTHLLSSMFIPLWHMIPGNVYSLCYLYLQCLFLFDIWFMWTPLLFHMIPMNPCAYSLCYRQCLFLFDIWFFNGIPPFVGNPFVIVNVYSSLTYESWEPLCYLQCLFLFDIWFLWTPLLSSMFIPLWHMIPGNPFVIFNVYSSLTYDSWEPHCYLQCLFLFDIWILGTPLLSSMFIPLWHMIPGNPFVIVNVYSFWTYDSWESLCYLQCVFLYDIWFLGTPLLSSIFIPLWHVIPGNPFVIVNVYSSLTYDSWESLCYLQSLFLFDIWFLGTPLLCSMFIPLWHMIHVNPFVIFNVYFSLTYDSCDPLCYLQCLFLFDIWFLRTPLLSSMFIPLWHMNPGYPFVIFNVYSSLTYDSCEFLCYLHCLFLFDIWFLWTPLISSMFIPLWHMIPENPFVIFNVYSSLTYDSWEPICYRQCLFLFDIWFLGIPLLSSMFIPLWHMIPGNPFVMFNVYSSLTYDSCEPLCYLQCLFLFDIWFLWTPVLSSMFIPLWHMIPVNPLISSMFIPLWHMIPENPFVIFNVYSSLTYDSCEPLCYI